MSFATFWVEDTFTSIASLPGFTAGPAVDWDELAEINHLSHAEVMDRQKDGHRPYVARMYGQPVAYGWLATSKISIGELNINVELPPDDRYLWDFATLPDWQGRGLYPRLLQSILEQEIQNAQRFWIIHAPENLPSGAGMSKAGFEFVGQLSFTLDGKVSLAPYSDSTERARIGADLLQYRFPSLNRSLLHAGTAEEWSQNTLTRLMPIRAGRPSDPMKEAVVV